MRPCSTREELTALLIGHFVTFHGGTLQIVRDWTDVGCQSVHRMTRDSYAYLGAPPPTPSKDHEAIMDKLLDDFFGFRALVGRYHGRETTRPS